MTVFIVNLRTVNKVLKIRLFKLNPLVNPVKQCGRYTLGTKHYKLKEIPYTRFIGVLLDTKLKSINILVIDSKKI